MKTPVMTTVGVALALTLISCNDEDPAEGGEGQPCYPNDTCDDGLECVGGVCVMPTDSGTDTIGDPAGDTGPDNPGEGECAVDGDCDDSDPCTTDICNTDGDCEYAEFDGDGDGFVSLECGGEDCDDADDTNYPGADNDGDGFEDPRCGGDDCDDTDDTIGLAECEGVNDCCDGCTKLGCYLDETTGYLWEDPQMGGEDGYDFQETAADYCSTLDLAGHGPGEWRLATISELRSLVRGCPDIETGGACGVTDSCLAESCKTDCDECTAYAGPGSNGCYAPTYFNNGLEGDCGSYWSSSEVSSRPNYYWTMSYGWAGITTEANGELGGVICMHPGS